MLTKSSAAVVSRLSKPSVKLIVISLRQKRGVFTCKNLDEIGATVECSLEIHQQLSTGG